MQRGEIISVTIDDVAFGGDGVARVDDFVYFVPFAVAGDEVEIEITEIKKHYGKGRIVRMLKPSSYRIAPRCSYYGRCGGCALQHIEYPYQLDLKRRQIEEALRRIGGLYSPPVHPVISSPHSYGWRGKVEFHLSRGSRETRRLGLMAAKSNQVVEVTGCLIADESINLKLNALKTGIKNGSVVAPRERQVIWADEPGEPPTAVFVGGGKPPDILRVVAGKQITVPGRGFFQANIFLVERLVEQVVEMASLSGSETVIDLYGGVGLFSLFLGGQAGCLFCVEGDEEAVRCARINLKRAGLAGAKCHQGDAAAILNREFVEPGLKADVVILDPPRDGCSKGVLEALSSLHPWRIVYVSCNPSTQARDVRHLANSGYCLKIVQPFDMFPQTSHIEAVALLTRGGG
ncbi:MAG: class I SAM-dependent RNA methyltransferase [Syntrophobacterales bacterium]|nr:class I SAM-dependent RNA methyltransferase [Syntrophobacterales bacterium]